MKKLAWIPCFKIFALLGVAAINSVNYGAMSEENLKKTPEELFEETTDFPLSKFLGPEKREAPYGLYEKVAGLLCTKEKFIEYKKYRLGKPPYQHGPIHGYSQCTNKYCEKCTTGNRCTWNFASGDFYNLCEKTACVKDVVQTLYSPSCEDYQILNCLKTYSTDDLSMHELMVLTALQLPVNPSVQFKAVTLSLKSIEQKAFQEIVNRNFDPIHLTNCLKILQNFHNYNGSELWENYGQPLKKSYYASQAFVWGMRGLTALFALYLFSIKDSLALHNVLLRKALFTTFITIIPTLYYSESISKKYRPLSRLFKSERPWPKHNSFENQDCDDPRFK